MSKMITNILGWIVHRRRALGALPLVLCAIVMIGCAQQKGVLLAASPDSPRWPEAPEQPRIRYLGSLMTDADLKPGVSGFEALGAALFGKRGGHAMLTPFAISTDDAGRVFVCDSGAQLVHVFDLESRAYAQWRPGPGETPFSQPTGIATDSAGRVYVADPVAGVVFQFDAGGEVVREIGAGVLSRPAGLAFDRIRDRIYVADTGSHRVYAFSPEGALILSIGERGNQAGDFNYPTNLAVDSAGRLYVSDSLNFRVQVFDRDLHFVRQIGSEGDMPGYFSQPKGLALDSGDHLYVVDARFETVQLFDTEGNLLLHFGREGREPGQFWLPAGIHIDGADRIWIADTYNRRVQVFEYIHKTTGGTP